MDEKVDLPDIPETGEKFWADVKVSKATEKTFKSTDIGKNLIRFESIDDMFGKLDN